MTTGNSADFGDLNYSTEQAMACANATRGLISGGGTPGTMYNNIEFITISSLGNSQNFGDMPFSNNRDGASGASKTRGIVGAGSDPYSSPYPKTNQINFVEISTQGNAIDFGDLTQSRNHMAGCTNGHGGL